MSYASRARASFALLPFFLPAACSSTAAQPEAEPAAPSDGVRIATDLREAPPTPPSRTDRVPGTRGRHPSTDAGHKDGAVMDAPHAMTDASTSVIDGGATGAWAAVKHTPTFAATGGLLLTDGTVMVSDSAEQSKWWRLTPDIHGSYVNGTWSAMAQMPTGYEPTFFSSAVLADGRVIVVGGEYNQGAEAETSLGALYDPTLDTWTSLEAPSPLQTWYTIGDSQSVVLPDGTFMIASIQGEQVALFDARTLTWTNVGNEAMDAGIGKADPNSEEGWTLLPSGKVLTVDVGVYERAPTMGSELFDPKTRKWSSAGSVGVQLADPVNYEIGPAVLMPNGSVFATGATGATALYGADGRWTVGPSFPLVDGQQLDIADGPAALLPNGHVLCATSPLVYQQGAVFFEFDGARLEEVSALPNAVNDSSYNIFFMLLPTGQVLAVDDTTDVEVYTSKGAPDAAWAPTITSAPSTVVRGTTYRIEGTQLNGLSQAVAYGDDFQSATNYPLVRITNTHTGHVFYGRTHDHSTMGVATGSAIVSTLFEAPNRAETGPSELVVVANGIPSAPVAVTLQ